MSVSTYRWVCRGIYTVLIPPSGASPPTCPYSPPNSTNHPALPKPEENPHLKRPAHSKLPSNISQTPKFIFSSGAWELDKLSGARMRCEVTPGYRFHEIFRSTSLQVFSWWKCIPLKLKVLWDTVPYTIHQYLHIYHFKPWSSVFY